MMQRNLRQGTIRSVYMYQPFTVVSKEQIALTERGLETPLDGPFFVSACKSASFHIA